MQSQTDAPEERDLWTAWQLFPLDDDQTCHSKDGGSCIFRWPVMRRDWVDVKQQYNSVHRKFRWVRDKMLPREPVPSRGVLRTPDWVVGVQNLRWVWVKMTEWEACPNRGWVPRLSSPGEWEKNADMAIRVGVNMLQFCSVCNSLLHTTLSIKCEVWRCVRRCPWCNDYRRQKWTLRHKFKSWMRLIAFHIALIPLGKVWIQLFSLQLWVNRRTDWVLQPWWGN